MPQWCFRLILRYNWSVDQGGNQIRTIKLENILGQEVTHTNYSESERQAFRDLLHEETKTLKRWFDDGAFAAPALPTTGLELEAWLLDENHLPTPNNDVFIKTINDERVVPELSKFNFELNIDPQPLSANFLSTIHADLSGLWQRCIDVADTLSFKPIHIGILPTVRDEMLQPDWMSDSNRYTALNRELLSRRQGKPIHINIAGSDRLDFEASHIMLEAACTSLQAHLLITPENAVRMQNASMIASGPLVAASANSPFLYGQDLWAETRIPTFEQSTAVDGFRDLQGRQALRVTFGSGYLRHSFLELFLENLSYPVLLPSVDNSGKQLAHLRLQNGTIWRWNRPILGFDGEGTPHLRIEHRIIPAGPTIPDMIANLALYFGLALALGEAPIPPENDLPFEDARANFYACAKHGLDAAVTWQGKTIGVQALLLEQLVPSAKQALRQKGVLDTDLNLYFDEILVPRLRKGQTGAAWQRSFVQCNGKNFQALTEVYRKNQSTDIPVHDWTV